jgi:hypothetical protein
MKPRYYSAVVAAGMLALGGMSFSANAASVSIASDVNTLPGGFIPFDPTPNTTVGTYVGGVSGSIPNVRESPYAGTPFASDNYDSISTGGTGLGNKPGAALFDVPAGTTEITILWGSPDPYNFMEFFKGQGTCTTVVTCGITGGGGLPVAIYSGTTPTQPFIPGVKPIVPPGTPDAGFNYVTFDVSGIGSIVLSDSGQAAFEFANVEFLKGGNQGIPIPAALPLFASGLGLLGLFARKKRKAAVAA